MWPFKKKLPTISKWRFESMMPEVAMSRDDYNVDRQFQNLSPEEKKLFKQLMKVWCKHGRSRKN
jgi:hypothetical protein